MTAARAVIFDFGNVIAWHPTPEKVARTAAACGLPVERFWESAWVPRLDYDAGLLTPAEYWAAVARAAGTTFDVPIETLIAHEVGWWNEFDDRVLAWADELRAGGIRTSILSNLPRVLGEALEATPGFLEHFDQVTFSYKLRRVKPEAGIYRYALEGLGVAAGEALFIDDKQANIEGARAVGIPSELFTTWEDFVARGVAAEYGLPPPGGAD